MQSKVTIIGIDALDSRTLSRHQDVLPNFQKLLYESKNICFDGVFPPDSPTSWASIYTGLNPAKHGIVLFVDPLNRVSDMISVDVDDTNIHGKTFWDIAGSAGKKVCILLHLLGYPIWPVNGIMVGRSGITADVQIYPEELKDQYDVSQFRWEVDLFPGRNKQKYIDAVKNQIQKELEFTLNLYEKEEWDLFFVSFGELDPIQYSLWNYYDTEDPSYPGKNQYENVILDFYAIFDDIIGKFLDLKTNETELIVVSDHGIGSRPVKLLNINEILRRKRLLKIYQQFDGKKQFHYNSALKKSIISMIDRHSLGNLASAGLRIFPQMKDWFIKSPYIDWENSDAYLTDQSGIKNYPYGGIFVNNHSGERYEHLTNEIIEELKYIADPETGKRTFKWICRREDIYTGEHILSYPDILFEMDEEYGAGSAIFNGIFGSSSTHNIAPGCHKQHHATLLISGSRKINSTIQVSLMDFTPTVLHVLNIDWRDFNFDGTSIFAK